MKSQALVNNFSKDFKNVKKFRNDTVEAVFEDYWETPQNSSFHSKVITRNKIISNEKKQETFSYRRISESSLEELNYADNNEDRVSFYESQDIESYINKYPTVTTILTKIHPKKWILNISNTQLDTNEESSQEKHKFSKLNSSNLTKKDIKFNKIQYMWMSEIDEQGRVKINPKNLSLQSLLTDPEDISPIVVNFPHPIQFQNISLPYEVLDPRSVTCDSFIWWDRRVWEYNFVHMARRLSTNDEKGRKKLGIGSPSNLKELGRNLDSNAHIFTNENNKTNTTQVSLKSPRRGLKAIKKLKV